MPAYQACSATHARIARECVSTVPSGSLSAGSFVSPVASRSPSREPLRKKGSGAREPRSPSRTGFRRRASLPARGGTDGGAVHHRRRGRRTRSVARSSGRLAPSSWLVSQSGHALPAVAHLCVPARAHRLAGWCTARARTGLRRIRPRIQGGLDAHASSHRNVRVSTSARLRLPCSAAMSSLPIQIVEVCSPFWTIPAA
jgi:hypothetical protein